MASTVCKHANPAVIKWARKEIEVSENDAASTLRVSEETYQKIENGSQYPTLSQLRQLAIKFKRPVATFFLPSVPSSLKEPKDYRSLVNSKGTKLKLSIRKARRVQNYSKALSLDEVDDFPHLELRDTPQQAAEKLREYLGVTREVHLKGSEPKNFFESIQQKLEADGISVLLHSFPKDEARAYSFAEKPRVVVISTNDEVYGARNFSLVHELAHIGLGRSGLCIIAESHPSNAVEKFCDKVAVNFLMPSSEVRKLAGDLDSEELISDFHLTRISNKLKSSKLALLIRFEELDLITHKDFLYKKSELARRRPPSGGGGGQTADTNAIKENGNPLTSKVIEGYQSGDINASLASKILNVNQSYIEAVGEKVAHR